MRRQYILKGKIKIA